MLLKSNDISKYGEQTNGSRTMLLASIMNDGRIPVQKALQYRFGKIRNHFKQK